MAEAVVSWSALRSRMAMIDTCLGRRGALAWPP